MSKAANETTARSVVEEYCEAWMAGDTMTVLALYHDDLVLTWPGKHQLAGVHDGQEASIEALLALQVLTNRVPLEIIDVLEGSESVIVTVVERWTHPAKPDQTMDLTRALEYTVEDNKLRTCRIYETEQAKIDEWIEAP